MVHASDLAGNAMQATFNTHMEVLGPDGLPVDPALGGYEGLEGDPALAGAQEAGMSPAVIDVERAAETEADSQVSIYIDTTTP